MLKSGVRYSKACKKGVTFRRLWGTDANVRDLTLWEPGPALVREPRSYRQSPPPPRIDAESVQEPRNKSARQDCRGIS